MTQSEALTLALRLWPSVRDTGQVADPGDLDRLLAAQGQPGALGYAAGVRGTFACFAPDEEATLTMPTGERAVSDGEARLLGHLLVTRVLMGAGLHIDRRVQRAVGDAYAVTWCVRGGYRASPLALATSLWLVALDPLHRSDRPIPIDWSPEAYQDASLWDLEYRLFSHYDIRERALDWVVYASIAGARRAGCSIWTIVEPLLRLDDDRSFQALSVFAEASDEESDAPASAVLERGRIAALLRAFAAQHRERRA
ncbi:MAG: hypothetical protein Q8M79_08950 [Dehalococcoidia bacterium]|nr:hypothetical protein [Dehalococcoidia bacterium]